MSDTLQPVSTLDPVRRYFKAIAEILTRPWDFFAQLSPSGGISKPLAFALITRWFAKALGHLWGSFFAPAALPYWKRSLSHLPFSWSPSIDGFTRVPWFYQAKDFVLQWFWGTSSVVLDPFLSAARLLIQSFVIYIGAKLLIPQSPSRAAVNYETVLKILCYASAPVLIGIVPFIGTPIANVYMFVVTVVGFATVFRLTPARAICVVAFPYLAIAAVLMSAFLALIVFAIKWMGMLS